MKIIKIILACLTLAACIPIPVVVPIGNPGQAAAPVTRLAASAPADARFDAVFAQVRRDAGLPPMVSNAGLDRVAAAHAADMLAGNYISHRDRAGRKATDRVRASGVSQCAAGENLAKGQGSVDEVMAGWMQSGGHRANLLSTQYANYGFGRAGDSWVLVLLLPC